MTAPLPRAPRCAANLRRAGRRTDAILKSPAFRDTVYAFRDWIAGQPYTPDELAKLKAEFQEKVETFSAPQLQQLLASSPRRNWKS